MSKFTAVVVLVSLFSAGCSTEVTPPVNPPHPTRIYLCDYGVHSSLLLPVGQRRYVEYLYGDWNWAALGHSSWLDALGAIFCSRQSTLGRRYVNQSTDQNSPTPPDGPKTVVLLTVNGDGCQQIESELNLRWEKNRATVLIADPPPWQMAFVKDDQPYSWTHDCNHLTADCLRKMGCRINGYAVWSKFDVVQSAAVPARSRAQAYPPESKDIAGLR